MFQSTQRGMVGVRHPTLNPNPGNQAFGRQPRVSLATYTGVNGFLTELGLIELLPQLLRRPGSESGPARPPPPRPKPESPSCTSAPFGLGCCAASRPERLSRSRPSSASRSEERRVG